MLQEIWPVAVITLAVIIIVSIVYPSPANYLNSAVLPGSFLSIILSLLLIPPAVAGIFYLNKMADSADLKDLHWPIGIMILIIFFTASIVTMFCMAIRPIDGFADMIEDKLLALEARTCKLIDRADQFIQGEVGPKGMTTDDQGETHDTPLHQKYVLDALAAARRNLGGEILLCPSTSKDVNQRIATLELTLRKYISPIFLRNFDTLINSKLACTKTLVPCNDTVNQFGSVDRNSLLWADYDKIMAAEAALANSLEPVDYNILQANTDKIKAIEAALTCYEKRMLIVMDANIERTKKGDLSDCEKANAVKT